MEEIAQPKEPKKNPKKPHMIEFKRGKINTKTCIISLTLNKSNIKPMTASIVATTNIRAT